MRMFQSVMDIEKGRIIKKSSNKNASPLKRKILCVGKLRDENLISYCLEKFFFSIETSSLGTDEMQAW